MSKQRILLVEDEFLIRFMVSEALSEEGYDVVEADSGVAALGILDSTEYFDALVTDVHMPGGPDGIQVALCARKKHPGLPVIFATGRVDAIHAFGPLGARDAVLAKPFSPTQALNTLRHLLATPTADGR